MTTVKVMPPSGRAAGHALIIGGLLAIMTAHAVMLWLMGHPIICKCGYVKLWHGVAKSAENSQHLTDWYTPGHVIHGFLLYGALHLVLPRAPFAVKLLIALGAETAWELFENTEYTINRYRANTIALDYYGDSVVNSLSDSLAMLAGFCIARAAPVPFTVMLAVALELLTGWAIRDGLALNVLMLLHPFEAIKAWQARASADGWLWHIAAIALMPRYALRPPSQR